MTHLTLSKTELEISQTELQEYLLLGRNNKYRVSHSVVACLLPGPAGTRKCRGCMKNTIMEEENYPKCFLP